MNIQIFAYIDEGFDRSKIPGSFVEIGSLTAGGETYWIQTRILDYPDDYKPSMDNWILAAFRIEDGLQFGLLPTLDPETGEINGVYGTPVWPVHEHMDKILNPGNRSDQIVMNDLLVHSMGGAARLRWGSDGDWYLDDHKPMEVYFQRLISEDDKHYWRVSVTRQTPDIDPANLRIGLLDVAEDGTESLRYPLDHPRNVFAGDPPSVEPPPSLYTDEPEDLYMALFNGTTMDDLIVKGKLRVSRSEYLGLVWPNSQTDTGYVRGRRQKLTDG